MSSKNVSVKTETAKAVTKKATAPKTTPAAQKVATAKVAAPKVDNKEKAAAAAAPVQAVSRGFNIEWLNILSPIAGRFYARGIEYHLGKGNLTRGATKNIVVATAQGASRLLGRVPADILAAAKKSLTTGAKMESTGATFHPAPKGFPTKYMLDDAFLKAGRSDSQAVFGLLLTR